MTMNVSNNHSVRGRQSTPLSLDGIEAPSTAEEGEIIHPTATVTNHTERDVEFTLSWFIDGELAGVEELHGVGAIQPGRTNNYAIEIGPMTEGDTEVCVEMTSQSINAAQARCRTVSSPLVSGIPLGAAVVILLGVAVIAYAISSGAYRRVPVPNPL